jgi:hypothetical protein
MSHLPAPDRTAVPTTLHWIEAVAYVDTRKQNVTTSLSASFTQPAVGGTVTITVGSSTAFAAGDTFAVSGSLATYRGGIYFCLSKPSSTSIVAQLIDPGIAPGGTVAINASVTTITPLLVTPSNRGNLVVTDLYADSLVCPGFGDTTRATVSVGWNRGGTPYSEFYNAQQLNFVSTLSSGSSASSTGATFTQPALNGSVTVSLAAPAVYSIGTWAYPVGTTVRIMRSGVYTVDSLHTTTTTANYTQPAVGSTVVVNVTSSTGFAVGEWVWVSNGTTLGAGAYEITATTATSLTLRLNNIGSSFLPGIASASVVASGATVTHAQKLNLVLVRDSSASSGQTIASGTTVFRYLEPKATTAASYVQPTSGTNVTLTVDDNRGFIVGTTVWVNVGFDNSAGIYSVASKTGLDRITLTLTTAINYAVGSTVPSGAVLHVRRQAGQVLPLRTFGTTRLSVDPGSPIGVYVSVSSNATAASVVAVHLRGFYVS